MGWVAIILRIREAVPQELVISPTLLPNRRAIIAATMLVVAVAAILMAMGRPAICACGTVGWCNPLKTASICLTGIRPAISSTA